MSKEQAKWYDSLSEKVVFKAPGCLQREIYLKRVHWKGMINKIFGKKLIYYKERLLHMSSPKMDPSPPSQNEEELKYFHYNHTEHYKRQEQAPQMNGMIFQKDWTPYMEHFILTFCHQDCWHHDSAGILPSASWAWFIFFTTSFYLCSGETLKNKYLYVLLFPKRVGETTQRYWICKNFMMILQLCIERILFKILTTSYWFNEMLKRKLNLLQIDMFNQRHKTDVRLKVSHHRQILSTYLL